jgi:hypothetical protein
MLIPALNRVAVNLLSITAGKWGIQSGLSIPTSVYWHTVQKMGKIPAFYVPDCAESGFLK